MSEDINYPTWRDLRDALMDPSWDDEMLDRMVLIYDTINEDVTTLVFDDATNNFIFRQPKDDPDMTINEGDLYLQI